MNVNENAKDRAAILFHLVLLVLHDLPVLLDEIHAVLVVRTDVVIDGV